MSENVDALQGSTIRPDWALPAEGPQAPTNDIGKDEFLQLLVAQLKYQDPLEPQSSDEFVATTAQFTVIEKLDELTTQGANTALVNSLTTAGSLIGKEVTANVQGVTVTGVVQRTRLAGNEVMLETTGGTAALNQISTIGEAPISSDGGAAGPALSPAPVQQNLTDDLS